MLDRTDPPKEATNFSFRKPYRNRLTRLMFDGVLDYPKEENNAPRVTLVDLRDHHCRYIEGDEPFLFCGEVKMKSSSYCGYHRSICYAGRSR